MELIRSVLVTILIIGLCYTVVRSAPLGDDGEIPGIPNPEEMGLASGYKGGQICYSISLSNNSMCAVDVILNTTRCSDPDNVNNVMNEETESLLPVCDCPGKSTCQVVKIGEEFRCESPEEQEAKEKDNGKFNMNMRLEDDQN